MEINQYEIVIVNLDPAVDSEIKKTRPCVVISPNEMNHHLRTITIAPMTAQGRNIPTRIKVRHNKKTGWVVMDQIRTIDKRRITKRAGQLTNEEIKECKLVIKETFVD